MSRIEEEVKALYERYPLDADKITTTMKDHGDCIRLIRHSGYIEWLFTDGYKLKISSEN